MKKVLIIASAIGCIVSASYAQVGTSIGFFENLPQRVYANPALAPNANWNIGVPALSGTYLEHGNNWFNPDEILSIDQNGSATLNAESILNEIDETANIGQSLYNEIIHVGFYLGKSRKNYIHFRAAERTSFMLSIPRDLLKLGVYGNARTELFENSTADFSDLNLSLNHYREYAIGFGREINEWLRAGITAKYLYGMENIETEIDNFSLRTNPQTYDLSTNGRMDLRTSGLYGLIEDDAVSNFEDIPNYIYGLNNNGFGLDLGVTGVFFQDLEIQVSALDIGWIKWRSDVASYSVDDASYLYTGVDLTGILFDEENFDENLEAELDSIADDLEELFLPDRETDSYTTTLEGRMRYAAAYDFENLIGLKGSVWASFSHSLKNGLSRNVLGLGYTHRFGNWSEVTLNLNGRNMESFSMGAGFAANAGPIQLYVLLNNLFSTQYTQIVIEDDNGGSSNIFYPSDPRNIRANFGLNVLLGRKKKAMESTPMID